MSITSYAQNFEDVLLWRALHDAQPTSYLDIGAQEPAYDSVSLAFYHAGWRGIHVEPTPHYAAKLRAARPDETVIEAAVSQSPGPLEFHEFPETGLSTGKLEIARKHLEQGFQTRTILVPTVRLDDLLHRSGEVPWMKIDVEGMESDVLRSWGDSPVRPWVLIIEATVPNSQVPSDDQWREQVISRDYHEVHFDGLSRYYVHEAHLDLASRFSSPPNVFDGFQTTARHFSTKELSQNHADQTAQLEGQIAELGERLNAAGAERDAANDAMAEMELSHREAASQAERVHRDIIDGLRRDHDEAERLLRDGFLQIEQAFRETLSALQVQLADNRAELAKLRVREDQHLEHAEVMLRDKQATEQRLRDEISSILDRHEQETGQLVERGQRDRADLEGQIADLVKQIGLADDIARKALAEPVGRWHRLGRVLGVAEEDLARTMLRSWEGRRSHSSAHPVEPVMSIAPVVATDDIFKAASLAELLPLEGAHFVRGTYAALLGREADQAGEAYYLERLRRGIPKIQVIDEISRSPEAKLANEVDPQLQRELGQFRRAALFGGKRRAGAAIEARLAGESTKPHVRDFMRYHDEEFVRVVFGFYLDREPDAQGLSGYVAQIRSGVSRQQVLMDVARSKEARELGRSAQGEQDLAALLLLERIPLVGMAVAAIRFNLLIRQHLKDMRAMQNHLYRLTQRIS